MKNLGTVTLETERLILRKTKAMTLSRCLETGQMMRE